MPDSCSGLKQEESQMRFSEYTLENTPINERPECPECSALIYLAMIEPEKPGFDLRTFECPRCQHAKTVVVELAS
jgi:transcriptional regulator NrdR family protein